MKTVNAHHGCNLFVASRCDNCSTVKVWGKGVGGAQCLACLCRERTRQARLHGQGRAGPGAGLEVAGIRCPSDTPNPNPSTPTPKPEGRANHLASACPPGGLGVLDGGLVFKAQRHFHKSTLGSRVIKKKEFAAVCCKEHALRGVRRLRCGSGSPFDGVDDRIIPSNPTHPGGRMLNLNPRPYDLDPRPYASYPGP